VALSQFEPKSKFRLKRLIVLNEIPSIERRLVPSGPGLMLLKPPFRLPNGIAHSMAYGLDEGAMGYGS
jgi:hypothetical protein